MRLQKSFLLGSISIIGGCATQLPPGTIADQILVNDITREINFEVQASDPKAVNCRCVKAEITQKDVSPQGGKWVEQWTVVCDNGHLSEPIDIHLESTPQMEGTMFQILMPQMIQFTPMKG